MYIFAINGNAMAGKDSFTERVGKAMAPDSVATISTIDPVKEYYRSIGWNGDKFDPAHRKVLNVIKGMWVRGDIRIAGCCTPYEWVIKQCLGYERSKAKAVFVMVREFPEMKKILDIGDIQFGGGRSIRVVRDGLEVPPVEQEFRDSHPKDYWYNFTIVNPTTDDPNILYLSEAAALLANYIDARDVPSSPLVYYPGEHRMSSPIFPVQMY